MKRRILLASVSVLALAVASYPVPAGAAPRDPGGQGPVEAAADHPWTSGGVANGASEPVQAGPAAARKVPLAAVSPATYAREKAAAVNGPAPRGAQAVPLPAPPGGSAQASMPTLFDGLDRPGAANNGLVFTPPDTIVGKSPNRILEGVNSALRLSSNSGGAIQTVDLNTFFGASAVNGVLFDPKVYFDRSGANQRFFLVALQVAGRGDTNTANDVARIWVAVSRSPDPADLSAGNWCRYNIDGRGDVGTANASWADYPTIGAGQDSFSFDTNQFTFPSNAFTFATVRVWNKNVAANNASSCPSVPRFTFRPASTAGDFSRFAIQPAQHYTSPSSFTGTTNPAYYLSTVRGTSNQYRIYRVRNVAGGSPTLAQLAITGNVTYGIPPSSPQPSSTVLLDTGDNRMLQVAGIGNTLVGTLTTVCNFTAGTPNESCSLTPRISVGQDTSGGLTATLAENTFAGFSDNIFVHHNSVATNTGLQSGATWEFSGPGRFLSSASMVKNVNASWAGVLTYAFGACALPSNLNRTGDYSGAQTDPGTLTGLWLAGEQAVTISGGCQWRTRIGALLP